MHIFALIETSVKQASKRQMHAAMTHLRKRNFECAITLGAAAEGILPQTDKSHTFKRMTALAAALPKDDHASNKVNAVVNWLKHGKIDGKPVDKIVIAELEAIATVTRAVSKFATVYEEQSAEMAVFVNWAISRLQNIEFN